MVVSILASDLPPGLQEELRECVLRYGGCLADLLFKPMIDRLKRAIAEALHRQPVPHAPAAPEPALAGATGPP